MIPRKRIHLFLFTLFIFYTSVESENENNATTTTTDNYTDLINITTTEAACEDSLSSVQYFTQVNTTHNTITVSWTYDESLIDCLSGYRLIYSVDTIVYENITNINETTSVYVIKDLEPCKTYFISVIAVGRNGNVSPVESISVTTEETQISSVNNLDVKSIEYGLTISWEPPNDVSCLESYNVSATKRDNVILENVSSKITNVTFHDLSACTEYIVRVIPVSLYGNNGVETNKSGETLPGLPGAISDLDEKEITGYSVYLSWLAPTMNADCVSGYNISICDSNNCTTQSTTELSFNATNLNPCLVYEFTVGAVGTAGAGETLSITVETPYVVPGQPYLLSATPGQFSMYIFWNPPLIAATCTTGYRITLYETGETQTISGTNFTFTALNACKEYTAQVTSVRANLDGALDITTTTIEASVEDPPVLDDLGPWVTKDTITIRWQIKKIGNDCPLQALVTVCHFTSTTGHGFEELDSNSTIPLTTTLNVTSNITVGNLSPFSTYNCYGYTKNSAGDSERTLVIATTSEAVPSAPEITVSDITNTSLTFGWGKPVYLAGNLIEHEIHFRWKYKFLTPESCNSTTFSETIPNLSGTDRKYTYSNAVPYSTYHVKIKAKTNAGWGDYGDYKEFETKPGVPGIVRNIAYENPANAGDPNLLDTLLSWDLPCSLNGEIESFNMIVHGTRENYTNDNFTQEYLDVENVTAERRFTHNFNELKAEYNYTFQISAKVKEVLYYGMYDSYNAIYPAGIPPMPDQQYTSLLELDRYRAQRSSSTVTVWLPLFEDTNGRIRYYAIMVSQDGHNDPISKRINIQSGNWPNVTTWTESVNEEFNVTYQATEPWWHPDKTNHTRIIKGVKAVEFTLGEDVSCSESRNTRHFCNGPLRPDTTYQIRMRAFTNGGYSDSREFIAMTKAEFNLGLVIGVVFGILFLGISTTMMLLVRRGGLRALIRNPGAQTSPVPDPLTRKKFEFHCQDLIENPGKLSNEFQLLHTLSVDLQMSTNDALLHANKKKNRYLDILPYDISRVKLDLVDNDPNTDYINASFVHGYSGAVEYIACQGPKEETTYDFWRMIFQYNVKVIVMVTQLVEKEKEKCHQYYPNMRENFEYEDITIRCSTQLDFVFYTQRNIILQMEDVKRTVTHLHFKEWSDHGVPDDFHSMLHFCQTVRKHMNDNKGVAVIHCSAGVGRTGTLITVDILLQHIRDNKRLDVFGTVFNLRKDRINMVQTESQYAYIYNCTRQALDNPYSLKHYKASSIEQIYETMTKKRKEITDSSTNLVNSAETLKKISPSSSIDSMEPIYEVMRQRPLYDTQLSSLSNGLRYSKSMGALNQPISPGTEIVRYGSQTYPIFEPAPDTLSNRGSIDRNVLLRYTTRPSRARLE